MQCVVNFLAQTFMSKYAVKHLQTENSLHQQTILDTVTYPDVDNRHGREEFLQSGFRNDALLNVPLSSFHKKTMNICTFTWR